ncbi:PQ-loop domain-containing transporter [Mycoplasma sp. Z473B]|uniref:PQ-loop domain-containing transporter n=1 Tax=Mycoplasma sp. Z473B TaxID=3401667 RepID=UPI003AAE0C69
MQNIVKFFSEGAHTAVTKAPKALDVSFNVFVWLTVVFIISLSVPQLIKLIKDKRTGNVSFTSFWIFHVGILLWVIWGATNNLNKAMLNVMLADGISLYVNGIMTILLYKHKKEFSAKKKMWGYIGVLATYLIGALFIAFYIVDYDREATNYLFKVPDAASTVMGFIFPAATTLAFTPQLIHSFKTNEWQGVTYWMYVLYVVNNIIWIIWWGLGMGLQSYEAKPNYGSLIAGLCWQIISLTIFGIQLGFTLYDKHLLSKGVNRSLQANK